MTLGMQKMERHLKNKRTEVSKSILTPCCGSSASCPPYQGNVFDFYHNIEEPHKNLILCYSPQILRGKRRYSFSNEMHSCRASLAVDKPEHRWVSDRLQLLQKTIKYEWQLVKVTDEYRQSCLNDRGAKIGDHLLMPHWKTDMTLAVSHYCYTPTKNKKLKHLTLMAFGKNSCLLSSSN